MGLKVSRKEGQRIRLTGTMKEGDEIYIDTQQTGGGDSRLKIYIDAPSTILILREELIDPEEIAD